MSAPLDRRAFLRSAVAAATGVAAAPVAALVAPPTAAGGEPVTGPPPDGIGGTGEGPGPYGPLAARDDSGVLLPAGFTARIVAIAGDPIGPDGLVWRGAADGAATFDDGAGGWFHAVNHELAGGRGGVSVVHYRSTGEIVAAYSVLDGTDRNCAGGPTPWGTWLSCEEVDRGRVFECDPTGPGQGVDRPALGRFAHEAVAVDPVRRALYLTEDEPDGLLYRFVPDAYPDLGSGVLSALRLDDAAPGRVGWVEIADPGATTMSTRRQPGCADAARFNGGEGIWYSDDRVWFTTKGDGRVWELDLTGDRLSVVWDPTAGPTLRGVDNITVEAGSGDLYVAEDPGNMELVVISAAGGVAPFARIEGHPGSEVTGPTFNPAGDRLYVSSQRGFDGRGVTYEIRGPFRGPTVPEPTAPAARPATAELLASCRSVDPRRAGAAIAGGLGAVAAAIAGIILSDRGTVRAETDLDR